MADSNARELCQLGDKLFSRKAQLDTLWQTLAEEVYSWRATFTATRIDGTEPAENQYTSLPEQNRRSLAEALGALTRRKDRPWFLIKVKGTEEVRQDTKDWLAWAQDRQRELLYNRKALFTKTTQVGDNDYVTFGNAVSMMAEDDERTGIPVFLPCHLRDTAWSHNCYQIVETMYRKFKISLRNVVNSPKYGGMNALSEQQRKLYEKDPYHEIEFRHCVMPNGDYDAYLKKKVNKFPFASIYINAEAQKVCREGGYHEFPYRVRRWFVDGESPYGYSPAAMLGLVEARLLQSQERVIMDAGERVVDPPSIATRDAVLGQVANYAGATTWIDSDYIANADKALQFLDTRANIPVGLEMKQDTREVLAGDWYINKLSLPSEKDMTAFEVNERIDEYIRTIGPAIEPTEIDNAAMLDTHFSILMRVGQLGPVESIPQELQGAETIYEFDGPVQMAHRRQKLMKAKEIRAHAFESMAARPEAADNYDFDKIDRDASEYMGAEPGWVLPEEEVAASRQSRAQAMQQQQQMQDAMAMGEMAKGAIEGIPAAADATQRLPDLMKGLGLPAPAQGTGGAMQMPQGAGGYLDLVQTGEDEYGLEEETDMPRTPAGAMPMDDEDMEMDEGGEGVGVAAAIRDLVKVLSAKNVVDYDKSGKPVGFHREVGE
jgi:hypothetical protein